MNRFNAYKFVADNAGLNTFEALEKVYQQGKADYEAECEKLFNENPPMHFSEEQIMWVKERMKLSRQQGKEDAIDNILKTLREKENEPQYQHEGENWVNGLIIAEEIAEQMKEQKNENET